MEDKSTEELIKLIQELEEQLVEKKKAEIKDKYRVAVKDKIFTDYKKDVEELMARNPNLGMDDALILVKAKKPPKIVFTTDITGEPMYFDSKKKLFEECAKHGCHTNLH